MKNKFSSETPVSVRLLSHDLLAESYGADAFRPDDHKAYVEFEICSALPNIHGPESHGRYFGFHPDVLANHYQSLLHSYTNINHTMRRHNRNSDRINGCVIAVSYPERPEGGWALEMSAEAAASAPRIKALAVVHKDASGVPEWIGQHLGGKVKNTVSIEANSPVIDVFDPADLSFTPVEDAQAKYGKRTVVWNEKTGWVVGKHQGRQLALIPGGDSGPLSLFGVGYVPRGAEKNARITKFVAAHADGAWSGVIASSSWEAGMHASWTRIAAGDAGFGVVKEVIESGSHTLNGITLQASLACPLLRILPFGKQQEVLRPADRVKLLD